MFARQSTRRLEPRRVCKRLSWLEDAIVGGGISKHHDKVTGQVEYRSSFADIFIYVLYSPCMRWYGIRELSDRD